MLRGVAGERVLAFVDEADGECFNGLCAHGCKGRIGSVAFDSCSSFVMDHTLQVIIEQNKDVYLAYVPESKGCHTHGDSMEEVMKRIKEAVDRLLSTLRAR
jgi:predicted RNase H-like HicB family nuclease